MFGRESILGEENLHGLIGQRKLGLIYEMIKLLISFHFYIFVQ